MTSARLFVRHTCICTLLLGLGLVLETYAQQSPTLPGGFFGRGTSGGRIGPGGRDGVGGIRGQQQQRGGLGQQRGGVGGVGGVSGVGGAAAGGAARPSQPRPTRGGGGGSGVQIITGGGGGGGGIRVSGQSGAFEPIKDREVEYGDLPPLVEEVTMQMAAPMTTGDFLDNLALTTGWNIIHTQDVTSISLLFFIDEVTPEKAMEIIRFNDVYYRYDEETEFLYVMTKDEYLEREYGKIVEREYFVEHVELDDIESLINSLLSPNGRIISDVRTSKIFVWDTLDNLKAMDAAIEEFDVPLHSQSFALVHLDVDVVADIIEPELSEQGEIRLDPRTNTIVVTDLPIRQKRIGDILEMLDTELETRSWLINYADPEVIADQIAMLVPEDMGLFTVNPEVHQITITATPERLEKVDALIAMWDIKLRQVQIETFLVTATTNVARELGINWSYLGNSGNDPFSFHNGNASPTFGSAPAQGQAFSFGTLPTAIPALNSAGEVLLDVLGNPIIRGFSGNDLALTLDYLETTGDASILANPRVMVQDGQEAIFENTTSVPFSQSTADRPVSSINQSGQFSTAFRSISRIEFIEVGTILSVLPRISDNDTILLDISAEDSSNVFREVIGADQVSTVPEKTQNRAQTRVMVQNRETIVLGGLRTSNMSNDLERVPILGDIPILGRIFRRTKKGHRQTELLIFITPTIKGEYTDPEAVKLALMDEDMAEKARFDKEPPWRRAFGGISFGRDEIMVAIGQSGDLFTNGELVSMKGLREVFNKTRTPRLKTVVIREHPGAPESVAVAVAEMAEEAKLDVDYDDTLVPFVPTRAPNYARP